MKEIIALHQKIMGLPEESRPESGVNFSRAEEDREGVDELPVELQAEVASMHRAINDALPEDFDYFVFVGQPDEEPAFHLEHDRMAAGGSEDKDLFQPEGSLIEQLGGLNWDELRAKAAKLRRTMDGILYLTDQTARPLRSTKSLQRDFREAVKEFIKEKRADAARIHLMYWDEEKEMMEAEFADGEALREVLPGFVARGAKVITIVAWGKPLPVERIDSLMAQAQKTLRERVAARMEADGDTAAEDKAESAETP